MTTASTLYCGFCGKSQHEVAKLVAGPTVHICNECVDLCQDICFGVRRPKGSLQEVKHSVALSRATLLILDQLHEIEDRAHTIRRHLSDLAAPKAKELEGPAEIIGFGKVEADKDSENSDD